MALMIFGSGGIGGFLSNYFEVWSSNQEKFQDQILERLSDQQKQINDLQDRVSELQERAVTAEMLNVLLFQQINRLRKEQGMEPLQAESYGIRNPIGEQLPMDLSTLSEQQRQQSHASENQDQ